MPRTRPQPPAPDSWNNPEPLPTTREPREHTPLQSEIISTIEDIQRHLNTVLNRVDINEPIGDCLVIKTARLNFLFGKYQASHDIVSHENKAL